MARDMHGPSLKFAFCFEVTFHNPEGVLRGGLHASPMIRPLYKEYFVPCPVTH